MYWLLVILALGVLIFVHELGHYLVARWCGMKVDKFSIGFGPAILKWKDKNGAQFQLSPILFGGYVAISGMNVGDDIDPQDKTAYPNKPTWQRIAAIFAGPGFNYLGAMVLAFVLFFAIGQPTGRLLVGATEAGFDAHGKVWVDEPIIAVNGTRIDKPETLIEQIQASKGQPVTLTVERFGAPADVRITPRETKDGDRTIYRIGMHMMRERAPGAVGPTLLAAVREPYRLTKEQLAGFGRLLSGKEKLDVRGPVGIGSMMKEAAESGWIPFVSLLMVLNVYLAVFNLLPLPALDGGRLAFLAYELITRRRANQKIEAMVHMVGIMFFLVVFIIVMFKDCARLPGGG